jgi:hypothetical protein
MKNGRLAVTYRPLSVLEEWPGNPKEHDLEEIRHSIERFGFLDPMGLYAERDRIVEGHGRTQVLAQMREEGCGPPRNILTGADLDGGFDDDAWMVPTVRLDFNSEAEAEAYLVAHNQTTIRGEFDTEQLAPFLARQSQRGEVRGTGFTETEAEELMKEADSVETEGGEVLTFEDGEEVPVGEEEFADVEVEPSSTRMAYLYLSPETFPPHQEAVKRLQEHYGTDNYTETVVECVERAVAALPSTDDE